MHRVLALAGLILMPLGFLHDSARDIAPLLRLIAPSYVAMAELFATELSSEGQCLDKGTRAFEQLSLSLAPYLRPPTAPDAMARVCRLGAISYLAGAEAPASGFMIRAHLQGGKVAWTNSIELSSALERALGNRLFWFGACVFALGFVLELWAFLLER